MSYTTQIVLVCIVDSIDTTVDFLPDVLVGIVLDHLSLTSFDGELSSLRTDMLIGFKLNDGTFRFTVVRSSTFDLVGDDRGLIRLVGFIDRFCIDRMLGSI